MDKEVIYPLEQAAYSIAHERVYTHANLVMAQEFWEMKNRGKPAPLLNGETNDRAYLADLMRDTQIEIQAAIDRLIAKGQITFWNPTTSLPTTEIEGAFVSRNEIIQLMQDKKLQLKNEYINEVTPLETPKIRNMMQLQQDCIIAEILNLGLNPKRLQKPPFGKSGVQALIRCKLLENEIFTSQSAFRNAWQELLRRNEIVMVE